MLIGPAGGGKTTARKILQRALVFLPSVQHREQHEKHLEDYEDKMSNKSAVTHMVNVYLITVESPFADRSPKRTAVVTDSFLKTRRLPPYKQCIQTFS